eukprot:scaffold31318_cov28-Tisochrysis_lutea.AAC.8
MARTTREVLEGVRKRLGDDTGLTGNYAFKSRSSGVQWGVVSGLGRTRRRGGGDWVGVVPMGSWSREEARPLDRRMAIGPSRYGCLPEGKDIWVRCA